MRIWVKFVGGLTVAAAFALVTPAAMASITPTLALNQNAGTRAGTKVNLGMDLKFSPGADSPRDLTLTLPAGLLANAAIDGGACLNSSTPTAACQVGTGTVTASPVLLGIALPTPVSVHVTYDLVAPPAPGDLAGLAVMATNPITQSISQLGSPGAISVRPASDPAGVGVNIALRNIPDTYALIGPLSSQIAVDEIKSTFTGLRMPTRCPSPAARFSVSADSYGDATPKGASAPLQVTGCSGLPFTPLLQVRAAKDAGDSGVQITSDVTQGSGQATSRTVALGLPSAVVAPNAAAVVQDGLLCSNPNLSGCKTIGSASATSPLYPRVLSGKLYLTGSLTSPAITIQFPAPFALTLNGTVDLATNTTTFHNLPDLPLSDLRVLLAGGPSAAFSTTCAQPSGTATGTFTSQDGDLTASSSAPFTVSGCPPSSGQSGQSGQSGAGGTGGRGTGGRPTTADLGQPALLAASLTGLRRGHASLGFTAAAAHGGPRLNSLSVALPRGLSFVRRRLARRLVIRGVRVRGARLRSLAIRRGRLIITLRRAAATARVTVSSRAIRESRGLRSKARHRRIRYLTLVVVVRTAAHKTVALTRAVTPSS